MTLGWTLEEVLTRGRGNERPFRCHEHEDNNASASVNVLKGVWYCYACRASGSVDDTKAPATADLMAMLEPEKAVRAYTEEALTLYEPIGGSYWQTRFPGWLCQMLRLGNDPFTGDATFPVYTPLGQLAGVGRRRSDPEVQPRYKYPSGWSASQVLSGLSWKRSIVVLTEGYADAASLTEVGIDARACFGAGLHLPQQERLLRCNPDLVVVGFDSDDAGEKAARMTTEMLEDHVDTTWVRWPQKDPAACAPQERITALVEAVRAVRGETYARQARQQWASDADEWQTRGRAR